MKNGRLIHDVLLTRSDGSKRKFRIYGRPMPESGDTITLPVDGRLIEARVTVCRAQAETERSADAEVVELMVSARMELV
jgi:hypothetical protein